MEQLVDQAPHLLGHGGGEEESLLFLRQPLENLFHIVDKAHVQHPIRLVQDEDLQPGQVDIALLVQVCQPARGCHQNIGALLQRLHLGPLAHAAEDDGAAQGKMGAVGGKAVLILDGQLPGGGENQRPDRVILPALCAEPGENGHGEGAGLSGAGLGAAQYVPARQGGGNGLGLNGSGGLIALLGQGGQNGSG